MRPPSPGKKALDPAQALPRGLWLLPQLHAEPPFLRKDSHVCQHEP